MSIRNTKMVGIDNTAFKEKIKPPKDMNEKSKIIWDELIDTIPNENLIPSDFPIMEMYCDQMATFRKAKKHVDIEGDVIISEVNGNPVINPWSSVMMNASSKVIAMSVKLRLSPSSRMKAESTHGKQSESIATTSLGKLLNG